MCTSQDYAEDIQIGLEGVELLDDNDLGFQTLNSFGLGYRLVGTEAFKSRVLDGADSLYNFRYDVGALDQIHLTCFVAVPCRRFYFKTCCKQFIRGQRVSHATVEFAVPHNTLGRGVGQDALTSYNVPVNTEH